MNRHKRIRSLKLLRETQPHWQCKNCHYRLFQSWIELAEQKCFCGIGKGYWFVKNGARING